jgi:DNA-binding FadR family transcriptional regulator
MLERELLSVGTMSTQVANHIGVRIVSGEFVPGTSLPIESELCQTYGVSRTTIREAIKSLAGKRLIEVSPKTGTRVMPFAEWNLLDRDVLAWRLQAQFDHKIVEDIFEMRLCFEPRASYLAARDGTAEDLAQIAHCFDELVTAYELALPIKATSESALGFHMAILNASHNGLFVTIGSAVKSALRVSSEMLQRHALQPAEDIALHQAVCSAIVARRPDEAADAMTRLLAASRERLLPLTVDAAE